jgi:sulfonate transport system ATP-binding protein
VAAHLQTATGLRAPEAERLADLAAGRIGWALRAAVDPAVLAARDQHLAQLGAALGGSTLERLRLGATLAETWSSRPDAVRETLATWRDWWRGRLLAGLGAPSGGELLLDGSPFAGAPSAVRMLFQDARLVPWQRVLENVGIAREPGWRDRAREALADVGLEDRAGEWPAVLSGGQRQRVALARALVSRPRLLLLDEPFGALDALTRREMHELLGRIWRRDGFTTVLITHDVTEAVTLAGRVLVLREGRFVLDQRVPGPRPHDPRPVGLEKRVLAAV